MDSSHLMMEDNISQSLFGFGEGTDANAGGVRTYRCNVRFTPSSLRKRDQIPIGEFGGQAVYGKSNQCLRMMFV
jgi:hypothetical protein